MIPSTKTCNGSRIVSLQIETTHDQCCPIGDPLRITHFCSIKLFEWPNPTATLAEPALLSQKFTGV